MSVEVLITLRPRCRCAVSKESNNRLDMRSLKVPIIVIGIISEPIVSVARIPLRITLDFVRMAEVTPCATVVNQRTSAGSRWSSRSTETMHNEALRRVIIDNVATRHAVLLDPELCDALMGLSRDPTEAIAKAIGNMKEGEIVLTINHFEVR